MSNEPRSISADDLQAVLHHAPDFIARLDADLRYRYVNARAGGFSGVPPEQWIGRTTAELGLPEQQLAPWLGALRRARDTGELQEVRASIELQGRALWFETRIAPEKDPDGRVTGLVLSARNVTESQEAVERLEHARRLLERTFRSLSEAVFIVDVPGRHIIDCNAAAEKMFGWERQELVGRSTRMLHVDQASFERFDLLGQAALLRGDTFRHYFIMQRRSGETFPTEHAVTRLDPGAGLEGGFVSVVRDRTDEVQIQNELMHYARRLEALRDLDRALLTAGGADELAGMAAAHALEILGCVRASVTLLDADGARLAAVEGAGPKPEEEEGRRIPACPFSLEALARGELQRVPDFGELPTPLPPALEGPSRAGAKALLTVPLLGEEGLLGALNLAFIEPETLNERTEEVAREMCDHLALALRQLRLREAVQAEARERAEAERVARSLQVRLEELLDNLGLGFLRMDVDGVILERNDAARRILGAPLEETRVGQSVDQLLWPGESWRAIRRQIRAAAPRPASLQVRIRRHDGSPAWVSALARMVTVSSGEAVAEGILQDITEEMELREEVVGISTRERLRIGQDLHDDLGQHLTGLAFLARNLQSRLQERGLEDEAGDARSLERIANLAVKKTRHLSRGVHPPALQHQGLAGALEEMARDVSDLFDVAVEVEADPAVDTRSLPEALHLFRIAQEATSNAARHGSATRIRVLWEKTPKGRRLSVVDDGSGFRPGPGPGLGLRIMQYRVRLLNGTLEVESEPGSGTMVRCTLPPHSTEASGVSDAEVEGV